MKHYHMAWQHISRESFPAKAWREGILKVHFMVIRKCLVYNLDLFAFKRENCTIVVVSALMKILKWKKIYGLNVYLSVSISLCPIRVSSWLLLVQTLRKVINFRFQPKRLKCSRKCTSRAICHIVPTPSDTRPSASVRSVQISLHAAIQMKRSVWENLLQWF